MPEYPDSQSEGRGGDNSTVNRTYKYRIYPTKRQIAALEDQLAFACDLWNAALEQRKWAYRTWGVVVDRTEQQRQLTELRQEISLDMNAGAQEMVVRRLHTAFEAFFRRLRQGERPGFPRFKAKHRYNTLSWRRGAAGATLKDDRLQIQGVGAIKVKWHRELPSAPKETRITRRNGRWYVAFAVEVERPDPLPPTGQSVGVDLGVRVFASLSNGEAIEGPRPGQAVAPAIRRAQRKVVRRRVGSRRRRKAVRELGRRREREANRRLDAAHKAARTLVNRFDLIAIEDLKPRHMVRGNRGLAREINDQGWSQFVSCLTYKAEEAGRQVVKVNPRNTSRTCPECGLVDPASRKGPKFRCTGCEHEDDADVNAARNILALARIEPSGANGNEFSVA